VPGDLIQGSGLFNGSGNVVGLVNGGGSARGSKEASALPVPGKKCPQDLNGLAFNDGQPSLPLVQEREGLRQLRERDAERRSCNLQAAQQFLERPEVRQGLGYPTPPEGLNPGYADGGPHG
jgi:hypothetical protein